MGTHTHTHTHTNIHTHTNTHTYIMEADSELIKERRVEKYEREDKLKGVKSNAKMLHGIINKNKRKKRMIGPFKIGNRIVDTDKERINMLKDEYRSQYSEITDEIDEKAAAGPDGVHAYLLIKAKEVIAKPLTIIMR